MTMPRVGISLPHVEPLAGANTIAELARAAECFGYHAVSVSERLLLPVRDDWSNDAGLPDAYVWDPIEVLTWAAAHTARVRLVTGIVNAIFQSPVILARRLATLDQLSHGRVDAGIGQGGGGSAATSYLIPEEFAAAGVPLDRRGAGFVEHIRAMRACWGPDPVEFDGEHYHIPRSTVGPKPYGTTIPLLLGAMVRTTIERAARLGHGFVTVAVDWDDARARIRWYRDAGGTGPVVVNTLQRYPDDAPVTPAAFTDAVFPDYARAAEVGADEIHVTLNLASVPPDRQIDLYGVLAEKIGLTSP
ncbi:TIGR03619 family F420-dependent LLM class oxidoreductase [Phytoactinopolyspora halotolerans]|uniref:TIGR03619 family F420-dependent LLM class oxidoreductase n=1 Tax=Phytoactinopolyspora halotolerans TaxID=1981512 RepID=A0A6L9S512_9ACTN|nr:TIGR03619 family F420-dependent LLM class oxidoreductase [Phytoactinopolyspora halotolerans]NEE00137.1 TIGR03619 family F420-dependent LLM class oxidoreductase [Phytoactinopolyspora halotolerans]